MKKRVWPWVTAAVLACVVCLGAYAYSFTPWGEGPSLTGDREADRACAATAAVFLDDDGRFDMDGTKSTFVGMSPDERRDYVRSVTVHSSEAEIAAIRDAGDLMSISSAAGDGLFGVMGFVQATMEMAEACDVNGWNGRTAGLVSVPE